MSSKPSRKTGVGAQGPSQRVRLRQQQAIAERRRRERMTLLLVAGVVVLGLVVGGVVWGVRQLDGAPQVAGAPAALEAPQPVTSGQPVTFGSPDAPRTVQLYSDFHCPHCVDFEQEYGAMIAQAVDAGTIRMESYPMAFIDQGSVNAANAFACSATEGYQRGYFAALWANAQLQWTPEQLLELTRQIGHEPSPAFTTCVQEQQNMSWITSIDAVAKQRQVTGTPMMFVDGEQVDISTLDSAALRGLLGM